MSAALLRYAAVFAHGLIAGVNGTVSGSRCTYWSYAASLSYSSIGSRFACDHLMLVT